MLGWAGHAKAQGARVLMPLLSPWEQAACFHQHHGVLLSSCPLPGPADLSERNKFANAPVLLPGPFLLEWAGPMSVPAEQAGLHQLPRPSQHENIPSRLTGNPSSFPTGLCCSGFC